MEATPTEDRKSLTQRVKEWRKLQWEGVKQRYRECVPGCPPKEHIVSGFCMLSGWLSLATLLPLDTKKKRNSGLEGYVVGWLVFLCLLLFLGHHLLQFLGPGWRWLATAYALIGIYRLQDLIFASLDNVFGLTQRGIRWQKRPGGEGPAVIALWNIAQVIVIFALGYQNLAGRGPGVFEGPPRSDPDGPPGAPSDFLYVSWTTLFPPGSGYTAISWPARMLVMAESASGLLIIGLTLAALIARIDKSPDEANEAVSATEPADTDAIGRLRNFAIILFFVVATAILIGFICGVLAGMWSS
jgi:hypothetical protein